VAEILNACGIHRAYIDAGGSTIYALGAPPGGNAWRVRLRDPSHKLGPEVMLMNNSVSTSEQSAPSSLGGDAPGHIIVPGTGKPLQNTLCDQCNRAIRHRVRCTLNYTASARPIERGGLGEDFTQRVCYLDRFDGQRTLAGDGVSFVLAGGDRPIDVSPLRNRVAPTSKAAKELLP